MGIAMLTAISVVAEPSISPEKDIRILREEIHRQELILTALKEKLGKLEKEAVVIPIKIGVDENGCTFEGEPLSEKELKKNIEEIPADGSVVIVADAMTPHRKVISIMDIVKGRGISIVSLTTSKSEPVEGDNPE